MTRLLMVAMMTMAGLASAQVFRTVEPIGLDLLQQREVSRARADVVVGLKTIDAPGGVRCGPGEFEPRVVTTLERECEVKVGLDQLRTIWVSFRADCLVITLRPPADGPPRLLGEYVQRSVKINGLESQPNFGALRLLDDGHYRIGNARGRWFKKGPSIVFDGPIAHWQATTRVDGDLVFTFLRGPLEYSITYTRAASDERRAER